MDSSSSSSSSSPSSSYGVARVSHISNPCIFGEVGSSSSSTYRDKKWKLMKWVSKLFKSGSNGGGSGAHTNHHPPQFQEDENMVFPLPPSSLDDRSRGARDKEELDRSISLSLADNTKRPHGYGWSMDNNRDFPRPFHGGLNPSSFIPPYEPSYQYRRRQRICGGCNSDIGSGNYLGCMGTFFHPECFRCHSCGYAITEHEFSLSGTKPYHKLCFKELTHPKCEVCHHFIPTNDAGLIEYRCHPFWNQKYCPSHEYDKTARCCSCERLESWDVRYYTLEDGRSLCLECMETAITDTGECQPLYHAIRDYYEGMYMKLDQQIPMLLVQREALNDAIVGEKNGYHHMPETRGLCLSEEQTVTSVLRRPRLGAHRLVGMRTQPQRLTRKCEVTAILVLYGLPRLLTGAILAHELMHGWLRLNGFRNLNPEVEEGICQVLSYMWLESEVLSDPSTRNLPSTSSVATSSSSSFSNKKGGKSNVEKKLGEFFKHQIAHDASPAYGGGFRAAHTHTCNPTGPENTHTHTCFHVHTKILPDESDEKVSTDDTAESCGKKGEKRPLGNREAVRKYREKKKAKAASLEDEVARLRAVNQQLVKRLQNQATLEAEVSRLKCLLVDLRGRIDGEIGSFPYQKPMAANIPSFSHMMNPCNVQCDDEVYCPQNVFGVNSQEGASINDQGLSGCDFDQLQCMANQNLNGNGNGSFSNVNTSVSNKRKGGHRASRAV